MAARRTVGRPLCDDVIADGALHGFALNLRGLYPRWPVHHTFFQRGSGRDSPGGGWGAGAKPRLCTCREFQYKIGKVRKTHEVQLREVHGPGGKSPGPWVSLFYTKIPHTCESIYSGFKFIKSMDPGASRRVHGSPYSIPKFLTCLEVYILVLNS